MRKYYICRDFSEACGISKYGYVFFSTILKEYGFEKIHLKDVNVVSYTHLTLPTTPRG
ncbi:hypothetical protein BvCmsOUNP049_04245 [Escherichia coli]|nr:hypothetical protein BvCmsOUNP049_04245 [Escherichia coli]